MNKKGVVLGLVALVAVSSVDVDRADARGRQSKRSKAASKSKSGRWPASQKAAAKRALNALEELDTWLKYYPSPSAAEFKKRSADAAYSVNRNTANLPEGTVKKKLVAASAYFRAAAISSEILAGMSPEADTSEVEKQIAAIVSTARQNLQDARKELSKR